jgi:hypothetical protein
MKVFFFLPPAFFYLGWSTLLQLQLKSGSSLNGLAQYSLAFDSHKISSEVNRRQRGAVTKSGRQRFSSVGSVIIRTNACLFSTGG